MLTASEIVDWAASSWTAEVKNGPLQNVHRRALDNKWRQLIRHFGGDDVGLCGPSDDEGDRWSTGKPAVVNRRAFTARRPDASISKARSRVSVSLIIMHGRRGAT